MGMSFPVNLIIIPWEIYSRIHGIPSGIMNYHYNFVKEKIFHKNAISVSLFRNVVEDVRFQINEHKY
jgi:hypothetical protein